MSAVSIDAILQNAINAGASDVHITVGIPPKMRLNGALKEMEGYERLLPPDTKAIADAIMGERQRELLEERGQIDTSYSVRDVGRFRVNIFRQRGSYALAIRLVATRVPDPEELGIPQAVIDLHRQESGLVLVTGPTGHGKSTTLAALIDLINNTRDAHVITLEDPIEFLYRHNKSIINQREIGIDSMGYSDALRAALREDPNVIMIGEMRDDETMGTAITAAETGHLVLSTLHTLGAANSVDRIIDVFPEQKQQQIRIQLASVLTAIISQQLIPTADGEGRVAAFEVMFATTAVRSQIREGKAHQLATTIQTSREQGMITMDDSILHLYQDGIITADKALQYALNPDTLKNKLK